MEMFWGFGTITRNQEGSKLMGAAQLLQQHAYHLEAYDLTHLKSKTLLG